MTRPILLLVAVVQSGQNENPGRSAAFMDSPWNRTPARSTRQNRRNLPNEIHREIGLFTVASLAFSGKIRSVLVHQPNFHKRVSTVNHDTKDWKIVALNGLDHLHV